MNQNIVSPTASAMDYRNMPMFPRTENRAGQNYLLHTALFFATVLTTMFAGAFWSGHPVLFRGVTPFIINLSSGVPYSISLLLFLSVHEFGHYFAALHHRISATLPYYIPVPPLPSFLSLGTMGAVIKIREKITETTALFDIGIAGPVSGFIVCVGLLVYGFMNLPPATFIYTVHPEYHASGGPLHIAPKETLIIGKNLLWIILERGIAPKNLPPMTEMYHYPFLFTGWLGSFVTGLNLLPVGQLDGGHIIYAMFGQKRHAMVAKGFLFCIIILGLPSLLELLLSLLKLNSAAFIPEQLLYWSWPGWIFWAFILLRFIGLNHPPTEYDHPLTTVRTVFGWAAITIFALTFTPVPFGLT